MTIPSCANCRFFRSVEKVSGICQRHSPTLAGRSANYARWPWVHKMDGCGDHEFVAVPTQRSLAGADLTEQPGDG